MFSKFQCRCFVGIQNQAIHPIIHRSTRSYFFPDYKPSCQSGQFGKDQMAISICCKLTRAQRTCNFAALMSLQKHPWEQLCSLWIDSRQPLVICQKMEMSKDQSEGNVGLSQTSWILSTLQLLPSSRGNWKRGECRNIFEGIQILSYPVGMIQGRIRWLKFIM